MKAFEFNSKGINEITELVEGLVNIAYMAEIEKAVANELTDRDGLMFLAGLHIGGTIASVSGRNVEGATEVSLLAYKTMKETANNAVGKSLVEALGDFHEAVSTGIEDLSDSCDCPACQKRREAENKEEK